MADLGLEGASMPWQETAPVDERLRFVADHRLDLYTMTELCARYGVSRKTGYKWLARMEAGGRAALRDRSRAPHHCPHRIPGELADLICEARRAHPAWGARTLLDWLATRHPGQGWPAVSTVGDRLARRGLVKKRRRRRPPYHPGVVPPTTAAPNDLPGASSPPCRRQPRHRTSRTACATVWP
jgi:transposase